MVQTLAVAIPLPLLPVSTHFFRLASFTYSLISYPSGQQRRGGKGKGERKSPSGFRFPTAKPNQPSDIRSLGRRNSNAATDFFVSEETDDRTNSWGFYPSARCSSIAPLCPHPRSSLFVCATIVVDKLNSQIYSRFFHYVLFIKV